MERLKHTLGNPCLLGLLVWLLTGASCLAAAVPAPGASPFPPPLESYGDGQVQGLGAVLGHRVRQAPFNLVATVIFLLAIVHTFLAARFTSLAHRWQHAHEDRIRQGRAEPGSVHFGAGLFHFLGEVEVVFGLWAVVLAAALFAFFDWPTVVGYVSHKVNFVEPLFVVAIMTLAATRPILRLSEKAVERIAGALGGSLTAWWLTILTLGPILGSFITEPAAMTISALLLREKFYELEPGPRFKYATLGLLFVNISVGGALTHFAAPPVLMVAAPWNWDTSHMLTHFGWKAVLGMVLANGLYFLAFRRELARLQHSFAVEAMKHKIRREVLSRKSLETEIEKIGAQVALETGLDDSLARQVQETERRVRARIEKNYLPPLLEAGADRDLVREVFQREYDEIRLRKMRQTLPGLLPEDRRAPFVDPDWDRRDDPVPAWVVVAHLLFMLWTVLNAHHPALFIAGLLFFLGFAQVTAPFQNRIDLRPPLLVGFFLAGLVVHGGLQGWWIQPVLGRLSETPLMLGAIVLTAFNDNAAITYLSTLVPDFTDSLKYAVVAGALTGGGLTVIANAPNPAGQSILGRFFPGGISPLNLFVGALPATVILAACFFFLR